MTDATTASLDADLPRGLLVLPLLEATLGADAVEWMHPGFLGVHLPDGSLLACGDGDDANWGWRIDHQRNDGTVTTLSDGVAADASLETVAETILGLAARLASTGS